MIIHVVQPGEAIYQIAEKYNIPVTRLINENGLIDINNLVVGQTIVLTYPEQTYIVREGDSLASIASAHDVTILQLLRNNPYLSDREFLLPGESIVVSYNTESEISTNGYAYPFIDMDILRKTLPFLTYLTIFNYRSIGGGEIIGEDETEIIQLAKEYSVAPIMSLSTLTYQGEGNVDVVNSILNSEVLQEHHINNILNILETKDYYGLNVSIVHLNPENQKLYENYITKLYSRLREDGYLLFLTITPRTVIVNNQLTLERLDYTNLGQMADSILLLSYGWGYSSGPPSAATPAYMVRMILDHTVPLIPPEKIFIGLSTIGYDWQLPYIIGVSRANSLNTDAAILLARQVGATIYYDENSQAPYFEYVDYSSDTPVQHIVWFKDARSVNALASFVPEYGIQGISIWNIMSYFAQLWLVINSQYKINKVIPEQ
ncbi:spore germination protein [Mobilisporobacter senegalensis]|uniref:Spore germination protein n=1 Tax=Mobilisporobacter senegalensis TaxID=1329262 RepID=A0A3N1XKV4_9FIRM|nr:LysM peptidoglycan-binding domain-containing protein [Mobilisporobacter senegalensis]ROR27344.1 spore germination protein [Mobilisporobacter senegalensis]